MSKPKDLWPGRCQSMHPTEAGWRCGLEEGHDGHHTVLVPSDAPWIKYLEGSGDDAYAIVNTGQSDSSKEQDHE